VFPLKGLGYNFLLPPPLAAIEWKTEVQSSAHPLLLGFGYTIHQVQLHVSANIPFAGQASQCLKISGSHPHVSGSWSSDSIYASYSQITALSSDDTFESDAPATPPMPSCSCQRSRPVVFSARTRPSHLLAAAGYKIFNPELCQQTDDVVFIFMRRTSNR